MVRRRPLRSRPLDRAGWLAGALALTAIAGCSDPVTVAPSLAVTAAPAARSVIIGRGGALPVDLEAQVRAAGGTLDGVIPEIGVAFASGLQSSSIAGAESVVPDYTLQYELPGRVGDVDAESAAAPAPQVASLADNEPFYGLQWAPAAVQAPEAWNAGYTGAGVRVAVLDGGLYNVHPDLAAGIDVAASRSFAGGTAWNTDLGTFWHGTHVAGIIGARDNGLGVIGIAPNATLIGVKVLHGGTGSFSWLLDAIVYAAKPQAEGGAGADVINMSLGAYIPDAKAKDLKADVAELAKAIDRATRYANAQGTTVIAAAGNDESNLDDNKHDLNLPGMSARVIGVSATGPFGWAYGNTDFARQSSYTNFGKAAVTLAAPGGDFAWPTNENCAVAGLVRPCWVFDMYLSTSRAGYSWAAGTSMASPVTAGIAALVIEANGGSLEPAQVRTKLQQGALDLGKPGFDESYGHGFVNAIRSVQ